MRTDEGSSHQVHEDESEGVSSKIFELPLLVGYKNYVTWLRHRLEQDTIPMAYGKRANAKRTSEKNSSNKDPTIEMVLSAAKGRIGQPVLTFDPQKNEEEQVLILDQREN